MKAEELIPGEWYYCKSYNVGCKYFMCKKHQTDTNHFTILGINGVKYIGYYPDNDTYREMTDEEKLKLL